MKFKTATITKASMTAWYHDLIYSEVRVTESPVYWMDQHQHKPSERDIFVIEASYLENAEKKNGTKVYKGIPRANLQFQSPVMSGIRF